MQYFTDLFTPATYESFTKSGCKVTGFRQQQQKTAARVKVGDRFLCYMTGFSRWVGALEVAGGLFIDPTPVFYPEDDPFVVRFAVRPIVWLRKELAVPIHADSIWPNLSFTRDSAGGMGWTGMLRRSLNLMKPEDGQLIERVLVEQQGNQTVFEIDDQKYQQLVEGRIRRADKVVSVTVPVGDNGGHCRADDEPESIRESAQVQAMLATMGEKMGFKIWLPRSDRSTVLKEWRAPEGALMESLPLNYDSTTLQTIEQIDVLWLKGRSIVRAFEVEHTTAVYSGILRMADLLALQPNMAIKLHIVAPSSRREKVLTEIQRPVFSLLDRGPLADTCTYLSYDDVRQIGGLKHLTHLSDSVLDDYAEMAG